MNRLILHLLTLLLLLPNAEGRIWTNLAGQTFEGILIETDARSAIIRRTVDRQKFTMPIRNLSSADQAYLVDYEQNYRVP